MVGKANSNGSLVLTTCLQNCVKEPNCTAFAFPGCYFLNLTNFESNTGVPIETDQVELVVDGPDAPVSMMFVKQSPHSDMTGVAGYPLINTFESSNRVKTGLAYLNRPTTCAFDSEGNLLLADTWNQRIRKLSGMYSDCHHHVKLNTAAEIEDYISKTATVETMCTSPDVAASYYSAQDAVLLEGNAGVFAPPLWNKFENLFCNYTKDAAYMSRGTMNLFVLCEVCVPEPGKLRARICPPLALCECRDAIYQLSKTSVYLHCPKADARFDKWHRFISAYLRCLWKPSASEMIWLSDPLQREDLKLKIAQWIPGVGSIA
jgi:hypothetical protein